MHSQIITDLSHIDNTHTLLLLVDHKKNILANLPEGIATSLNDLITKADFSGDFGDSLFDYQTSLTELAPAFNATLLLAVGDLEKLTANQYVKLANKISQLLNKHSHATLFLPTADSGLSHIDITNFARFSLALLNNAYCFDDYKNKKSNRQLKQIDFYIANKIQAEAYAKELAYNLCIHQGQSLTRDLGNQPANICFPAYMAAQARTLASEFPDLISVEVLGESEMEALGMGCFLAVAKGSDKEGQLITISYTGANKNDKPVVFVGKGVTFDTGGISLKPGAGMEEMKFDMCGSAAVMGVMRALCLAKLPINVVGALACAENMPSGGATRPGDIVTAMNGKTVEILNTDAEGRLVLCDTLSYVEKFNPSVVVDMATLTGACVIALGSVRTALFTKDDALANELFNASNYIHDRVWHMPLDDDYQEQLESPCADIQNIGGRPAGSITAACFLSRFTQNYTWAHLDIAGSAWISGKSRNATGRPVPMLMQFLRTRAI